MAKDKENRVTKRELVYQVAEQSGYKQKEVTAVVQGMLDTVIESLAEGERLELRNFGVFEVKMREPRTCRNPRTGETVEIGEQKVVTFRPGKALKEWVQTGEMDSGFGQANVNQNHERAKGSHDEDAPSQ